jgi:pimeloyl-ACP methyl ester carboxylesterase
MTLRKAPPLFLIVLSVVWLLPLPARSAPPECGAEAGPPAWRYCIYPGTQDSKDVLWYLHGRGGSEKTWRKKKALRKIQSRWAERGLAAPTVVAASFGRHWLLTPKLSKPASGLLEYFEDTVIPALERKIGGHGRRLLLGHSMGGFNAAELWLSGQVRFDRVALACPALTWISPWAKLREITSWSARNHVNPVIVLSVLHTARAYFAKGAREWESAAPLYLARERVGRGGPPLLLSVGQHDSFGFFPGTHDLYELAQARGDEETLWKPVPGGHCAMDSTAIADFLTEGAPQASATN